MLNLKEAGRYSKYLTQQLSFLIQTPSFQKSLFVKVTEDHLKSQAIKDAVDVLNKELTTKLSLQLTPVEVMTLITMLLEEKVNLANAIAVFKASNNVTLGGKEYSLDAAIEYAKTIRLITETFIWPLEGYSEDVLETKSYDKTFNAEGNQVNYEYPVVRKTTLAYEKDVFKSQGKAYNRLANELSMEIENISSFKGINFQMKFDYLGSMEDLVSEIREK